MLDHKALMMIALQDTALHLQRRRPWARAFTSAAVRGYEELVSKRVKQLIGELEKQKGRVDLNEWFKCFAYALRFTPRFLPPTRHIIVAGLTSCQTWCECTASTRSSL